MLKDAATYYRYLSVYYPEGRHGGSVGSRIREGYPHIALVGVEMRNLEGSLAHELTHASLDHLPLPLWVEEGLAQILECGLSGRSELLVNGEMAAQHKRFWERRGLDPFWWGKGFGRADKGQRLSGPFRKYL